MSSYACAGKQAFDSPEQARPALRRCRGRTRCNAYRCPECGKWHIGARIGAMPVRAARSRAG